VTAAVLFVSVHVAGTIGLRDELTRFAAVAQASSASSTPDLRLWSPERVHAWKDTLTRDSPPPLAILRIARLGIEVPVLEGTDDWTLNRAVGLIEETAKPGGNGNAGIAGHRDGYFRALKDIRSGDLIEMDLPASIERYRVERVWVVQPEDISVLDPTPTPAITLVTCYPFYFVGSAPQRFIVRAVRTERTEKKNREE